MGFFDGGIVTEIGKIGITLIDELFETEEEKANARATLMKLEQEGKFKEMELQIAAILAEAKSSDPWTSRARPSFLYVMYLIILAGIPMGVLFAFNPTVANDVTSGFKDWLASIPEPLYILFGTGYLGYTGARTWDKMNLMRAKK